MGGKQEKWLYNKLATSQATWKIIAQQVIVSQMHNLQKPKKGVKVGALFAELTESRC